MLIFALALCLLDRTLRKMMRDNEDDWGKYLNAAVFSINTSVQATTKFTPFRVMYGREARFPLQVEAESSTDELIQQDSYMSEHDSITDEDSTQQFALESEAKKASIFTKVSQHIATAQEKQKRNFANRRSVVNYNFKVGDKVLWRNMLQKTKKGHKMEDRWLGPYEVANAPITKGTCYLLNKTGQQLKKRVSLSQLKPYISAESPNSLSLHQSVSVVKKESKSTDLVLPSSTSSSMLSKDTSGFLIATESYEGKCTTLKYSVLYPGS